ncbi:MAG: GGDEF domain-containing protein [Wenzhouxiangellaceae bacterium]|nr:GGDEF domain-containing protein [Wenzhouxiangellaceae bacterium]
MLLCVAIAPLALILPYQLSHVESILIVDNQEELMQVARVQQRRVNAELAHLENQLELIASRTQMRIMLDRHNLGEDDQAPAFIGQVLADARVHAANVDGLWVYGSDGRLVTADGPAVLPGVDPLATVPIEARAAGFGMQPWWPDPDYPDEAALWLRTPLHFDGRAIGMLIARVLPTSLVGLLADFPSQDLIGESFVLLQAADRRANPVVLSSHAPIARHVAQLPGADEFTGELLSVPVGQITPIDTMRGKMMLVALPLDYDIGMLYFLSQPGLVDRVRGMLVQSIQGGLALNLVLVVVIAWWFANRIAYPVHRMADQVARLQPGERLESVEMRGWPVELKTLAATLEAAADTVAEHTRALQDEVRRRRQAQVELINVANTDELTGLANRRHFMVRFRAALECSEGQRHACDLIYLDLDRFKPVNDRHGHDAGDAVLRTVAERIRYLIREQDLAARLGGDEFAVLLLDIDDEETSRSIAQRIEASISRPISIGDITVDVDCSVGYVRICDGMSCETALQRADRLMYRHKTGKSRSGEPRGVEQQFEDSEPESR